MQTPGKLITLWTGTHACLIYSWGPRDGGESIKVRSLNANECSSVRYLEVAGDLLETESIKGISHIWLILQESFPYGSFIGDASRAGRVDSTWYDTCWQQLPDQWMPQRTYNGIDVMKAVFRGFDQLLHPGTCLYFNLGERAYLLGYEDNDVFVRSSRIPLNTSGSQYLTEDWLQQSRMLYKNRTGYSLREIYVFNGQDFDTPGSSGTTALQLLLAGSGIQLMKGNPAFPIRCITFAINQLDSSSILELGEIDLRKQQIQRDKLLKTGSVLLLMGWVMLVAGACQSVNVHDANNQSTLEWENAKRKWDAGNQRWENESHLMYDQAGKFLVLGTVCESVPDSVMIDRIHLKNSESGENMQVTVAGKTQDGDGVEFHGWIDNLAEAGIFDEVNNLDLDILDRGLRFVVEATSGNGDLPQ